MKTSVVLAALLAAYIAPAWAQVPYPAKPVRIVVPYLPTMAEAALPGFESNQWWGVSGPAGMPAAIVTRLNAELDRILHGADLKQRFAADGAQPDGGTPNDFAVYLKNDYGKWGKVIKTAGIKSK